MNALHTLSPPEGIATGGGVSSVDALRGKLNAALRGKEAAIDLVLAVLLAHGHLLIEDLPGLGKTTLAKALSLGIGGKFARIQGTPDLLPSDITGFNVFNQQMRCLEFVPGPVFADVLLADEINRATPRTQSALLEAMAEQQVTVDNVTYPLSDRFFVIATQNPIEVHGTFPLPEALLDRFALKLRIGYPQRSQIVEILGDSLGRPTTASPQTERVLDHASLTALQAQVSRVAAGLALREYLATLGDVICQHPQIPGGISPRGLLIWLRLAQAWAFLRGRHFVTPADVQAVALPTLEVRLNVEPAVVPDLVAGVLGSVEVPNLR
jgi:MoxR-like ATPase